MKHSKTIMKSINLVHIKFDNYQSVLCKSLIINDILFKNLPVPGRWSVYDLQVMELLLL